jgi:hypothetical protein
LRLPSLGFLSVAKVALVVGWWMLCRPSSLAYTLLLCCSGGCSAIVIDGWRDKVLHMAYRLDSWSQLLASFYKFLLALKQTRKNL